MMRSLSGCLSLALLVLVACKPMPAAPIYDMPRYDHLPRVVVNAATFSVQQSYVTPQRADYVDAQLPVPLTQALTQWVHDRVQPAGADGEVVFTIHDAHVLEVPLRRTAGVKGLFVKDQVARYELRIWVEAALQGASMNRHAEAEARAAVSRTLPENATEADRTRLLHDMMKEAVQLFDQNMAEQLRLRFTP